MTARCLTMGPLLERERPEAVSAVQLLAPWTSPSDTPQGYVTVPLYDLPFLSALATVAVRRSATPPSPTFPHLFTRTLSSRTCGALTSHARHLCVSSTLGGETLWFHTHGRACVYTHTHTHTREQCLAGLKKCHVSELHNSACFHY